MNREEYILDEFNKIIQELHSIISSPQDLNSIAISLKFSRIQCLILDSAFKGLPTWNLSKILLIVNTDFNTAIEDMTLKLATMIQSRTYLNFIS